MGLLNDLKDYADEQMKSQGKVIKVPKNITTFECSSFNPRCIVRKSSELRQVDGTIKEKAIERTRERVILTFMNNRRNPHKIDEVECDNCGTIYVRED
jgi:hypothetical protein